MKLRPTGKKRFRSLFAYRGGERAVIKKAKKIIRKARRQKKEDFTVHSGEVFLETGLTGIMPDLSVYYGSEHSFASIMDQIMAIPKVGPFIKSFEFVKLARARITFVPYHKPVNGLVNYQCVQLMCIEPRPDNLYPSSNSIALFRRDHKKFKMTMGRKAVSMAFPSIVKSYKDCDAEVWQNTDLAVGSFYATLAVTPLPTLRVHAEVTVSTPPIALVITGLLKLRYTVHLKKFKNFN